jgi:hypothetical protein
MDCGESADVADLVPRVLVHRLHVALERGDVGSGEAAVGALFVSVTGWENVSLV